MEKMILTVPTLLGTESIVANEIRSLGYETEKVVDGNVSFYGDFEAICRANINLRTAERILIKMGEFRATDFEMLFQGIKKIEWERFIGIKDQFPVVRGHSIKSGLKSIPNCQKIIKKAVVTRLSEKYKIKWFEETEEIYPIQFAIMKDIVSVYIDTSGNNLYKRGYRENAVLAPMRETLASAMIDLTFWRGDRPLLDPFCGSGTISIEAAMYAANIAPGLKRTFSSMQWKKHIPDKVWENVREDSISKINKTNDIKIIASDISQEAVDIAVKNAENAGVSDLIKFEVCDVSDIKAFKEKGVIVTNPPYGERLMSDDECKRLYKTMNIKFSEFSEAKKFIITSNDNFERYYGDKADKKRKVYNGMLKCYIYQYFR